MFTLQERDRVQEETLRWANDDPRVCVERSRYWPAEYWVSAVRDNALTMACIRLGMSEGTKASVCAPHLPERLSEFIGME
jgi:hypothetical protein